MYLLETHWWLENVDLIYLKEHKNMYNVRVRNTLYMYVYLFDTSCQDRVHLYVTS